MEGSAVTSWYGVFIDAYTYSSNNLIISLTVTILSLFVMWIYEKPQFYKLVFKRSKHSNILSPIQSVEDLEENCVQNLMSPFKYEEKKSEIGKDDVLN